MSKKAHSKKTRGKYQKIFIGFVGFVLFVLLSFLLGLVIYNFQYRGKIFPNIYLGGIYVGGLSKNEASEKLQKDFYLSENINLFYNGKEFNIPVADIGAAPEFDNSITRAYNITRTGNFIYDFYKRLELVSKPTKIGVHINYLSETLIESVRDYYNEDVVEPIYPQINLTDKQITIDPGKAGVVLDMEMLDLNVGKNLSLGITPPIIIPTSTIDPTLNEFQIQKATKAAESLIGKTLVLKFEYLEIKYKDSDLVKFLNPEGGFNKTHTNSVVMAIASKINRSPQNPKFQFDGTRVTEFAPALVGVNLDSSKFKEMLVLKLTELTDSETKELEMVIPTITKQPDVSTEEVNNLGIKELIGRGASTYYHSIPGRVFNVNLAAGRINGTLVAPNETFSFNQTLGDVSKFTGYKEAYIISQGKTILGDGGGVCQVSSTLFRAVLNAGLPVDERSAHAYRVGYYEQNSPPGLDATVYSPKPDFKFTNNTDKHILLIAKNDPKNYSLVFEIYGTNDGRTASTTKPVISNYQAPLPTVYQDDPTLPAGTTKQVDFAAAGARVTFTYTVKKGTEEIFKKTFVSNYRPWASVFLRGTKN